MYVYYKWELSMHECMFPSDAPSYTLPVLPLRVVPQSDLISARANLFFALDRFRWITGESLVERFVDQAVNPGYMRWFCRKCGSAVPRLNRTGQYYVVPAGLLDGRPKCEAREAFTGMTALRGSLNIDASPKLSEGVDSVMREQARNDLSGTYPPGI